VRDDARVGESAPFVVSNEFATVRVTLDADDGRNRLRLEDLRTGRVGFLDALELESLAWSQHSDLAPLLDPNLTRWASGGPADPDPEEGA
jgi:hypothetical protein